MERDLKSNSTALGTLPKWSTLAEKDVDSVGDLKGIKFPIRDDINEKLILWQGDIRQLDVDAIVNSTNESMTDNTGISGSILEAAGPELVEEIGRCDHCRTGEARVTKAYNLPARFIIHTVGPRYNDKYKTAAENALHNCYRSCLEGLKENNLHTIAFPVINSQKRGYPSEPGSHIAIRTVRRFLEHWGKDIETIVFCVHTVDDFKLYSRVLSMYFPRSKRDLILAKEELPRDTGNEYGETVIEERKIRISAFPGTPVGNNNDAPLSPTSLSSSSTIIPEKLPNAFAMMKTDFDEERKKKIEQLSQADKDKLQQQQVYLNYLYKAQGMDLSDIARLNVIYESGKDSYGRPIVVMVGSRLPMQRAHLDRVFLYMIRTLDRIVENPYVVVYLHTNMEDKDTPEFTWMKQVYNIMDYKYGDHLSSFYVIHPTFWLKIFEGVVSKFMDNDSFWTKVRYVHKLDEMYDYIDHDQLVFPEEVYKYDVKVNGSTSKPARRVRKGNQTPDSIVNDDL